jgi:hypothetical protein
MHRLFDPNREQEFVTLDGAVFARREGQSVPGERTAQRNGLPWLGIGSLRKLQPTATSTATSTD